MASLTAHLRRPDDHGRLSFHPACPICCGERLSGTLPADALIGRRSQALLAASVLALSYAAPNSGLAGEPDQEQEGTTAPEQIAGDDPSGTPQFEAAGQPTELPLDAGAAPDDTTALDPVYEQDPPADEQGTNEDVSGSDPTDETGTPNAGAQEEPPAAEPPPPTTNPVPTPAAAQPTPIATSAPSTAAPPASTPPSDAPPAQTEPPNPAAAEKDANAKAHAREREAAEEQQQRARATTPAPMSNPAPAPQPEPVYVVGNSAETTEPAPQQAAPSAPAAPNNRALQSGDRAHTVKHGESLWSIAGDLVGESASAARIAREVNRLWELNSARIGTGDRNLLMVGTRIVLR